MVSIAGLPSNTILAYRVKNIGFLTGLEADLNNVSVKDMTRVTYQETSELKSCSQQVLGHLVPEIVYSRP